MALSIGIWPLGIHHLRYPPPGPGEKEWFIFWPFCSLGAFDVSSKDSLFPSSNDAECARENISSPALPDGLRSNHPPNASFRFALRFCGWKREVPWQEHLGKCFLVSGHHGWRRGRFRRLRTEADSNKPGRKPNTSWGEGLRWIPKTRETAKQFFPFLVGNHRILRPENTITDPDSTLIR